MIVSGVDPHKQTHTAAAVAQATGELRGERTVKARRQGHAHLLAWARSLADERLWALEDCRHVSIALERFLLASGERVVRVPPKLMAAARRSSRERGKSDAIDALAVARAALREPRLQVACLEQTTQVRICRELVRRSGELSRRAAELERELTVLLRAQAPALLEVPGCGVLTAAKLVGETAGVCRFASEARLAMHAGAAPLEASSGKQRRHRLNRSGNRQLNVALHRIAVSQGRWHPPARAYLARKEAEGRSRREALRCLKRQLVRTVYGTLRDIEQGTMTSSTGSALVPALT